MELLGKKSIAMLFDKYYFSRKLILSKFGKFVEKEVRPPFELPFPPKLRLYGLDVE
jgi:hypothetical protein